MSDSASSSPKSGVALMELANDLNMEAEDTLAALPSKRRGSITMPEDSGSIRSDAKMRAVSVALRRSKAVNATGTVDRPDVFDLSTGTVFHIGDKVAYCDPRSRLWKRGEIVYHVSPEYKVEWGGTWQWVDQELLINDTDDLDWDFLRKQNSSAGLQKKLERRRLLGEAGDEESLEDGDDDETTGTGERIRSDLIAGVDWSKFGNILSDALIEKLWRQADQDMNGYLSLEELDVLLHEIIKLFLAQTQGVIAGGVTYTMTKPFVDLLRDSILNNLDTNQDGNISYKEFQNYSMWLPSALKNMFKPDGSGLSLNLRDFAMFINEHMVSALIDRVEQQIGKKELEIEEIQLVCHKLIEDFVAKNGLKMKLSRTYTETYVNKMVGILLKSLYPGMSVKERAKRTKIGKPELEALKRNMSRLADHMPSDMKGVKSMIKNAFVIDLNELYNFFVTDDAILDELWSKVDVDGNGTLDFDEVRVLLHSLIERYAHHMGMHSLLNVDSVGPMVESLVKLTSNQLDLIKTGRGLTKEEFKDLPKLLAAMKTKALQSIDASKLQQFTTAQILEEIWEEIDTDQRGWIPADQLQDLIRALVVRYVGYAVSEAYATGQASESYRRSSKPRRSLMAGADDAKSASASDSSLLPTVSEEKKMGDAGDPSTLSPTTSAEQRRSKAMADLKTSIRKKADLIQFGVVDTVLKGLMPAISARMDVDKNGRITKEEFMDIDSWLPNISHYMGLFSFDEFEGYLNRGVINKLWKQLDGSEKGYISKEELRDLLDSLMISYADQIGMSAFIGKSDDDSSSKSHSRKLSQHLGDTKEAKQLTKMLHKFGDMIFARFDIDGDGKITKEELHDLRGAIGKVKKDLMGSFDWSGLSGFIEPDRIEQVWNEFSAEDIKQRAKRAKSRAGSAISTAKAMMVDGEEAMSADKVRSMIALMVEQYVSQNLEQLKKTNPELFQGQLAGIETIEDLHAFGVISQCVDSVCSLISSASVIRVTAAKEAGSRLLTSRSPSLFGAKTGHQAVVSVGLMTFREHIQLAGKSAFVPPTSSDSSVPVSSLGSLLENEEAEPALAKEGSPSVVTFGSDVTPPRTMKKQKTRTKLKLDTAVAGVRLGLGDLYDSATLVKKKDLLVKLPQILSKKKAELQSIIVNAMEKMKRFDYNTLSNEVVAQVILGTVLKLEDGLQSTGGITVMSATRKTVTERLAERKIHVSEIETVVSDSVRTYLGKMSAHGSIIAAHINPVISNYISELKIRLTEAGIVGEDGSILGTDLKKFAVKMKGGPAMQDVIEIDFTRIEREFVGFILENWMLLHNETKGITGGVTKTRRTSVGLAPDGPEMATIKSGSVLSTPIPTETASVSSLPGTVTNSVSPVVRGGLKRTFDMMSSAETIDPLKIRVIVVDFLDQCLLINGLNGADQDSREEMKGGDEDGLCELEREFGKIQTSTVRHALLKWLCDIFMHHLVVYAFGSESADHLAGPGDPALLDLRMSQSDVIEVFNRKIMKLVINSMKAETSSLMGERLMLGLLSLDISMFGKLIDLSDVPQLWKKYDNDGSGYLDILELENMLTELIQQSMIEQHKAHNGEAGAKTPPAKVESVPSSPQSKMKKSEPEVLMLSKSELRPVVMSLAAHVMDACDSNGDGSIDYDEFKEFVEYLKSASTLSKETAAKAKRLLHRFPNIEALQAIVGHIDSPLSTNLKSQTIALLCEMERLAEMEVDDLSVTEKKMVELSDRFMATTLASQVLGNQELSNLLALPSDQSDMDGMHPKMREILKDIQEEVLSAAVNSAERSKKLFSRGKSVVDEKLRRQTTTKFDPFGFTADDFSSVKSRVGSVANTATQVVSDNLSAANEVMTGAVRHLVRGMGEVAGFNEQQLKALDSVLAGVEDGLEFAEKLIDRINDKIQLADKKVTKVTLNDLINMLKGKNLEDTELFKVAAESLDEIVKEELAETIRGMKDEMVVALEAGIRQRAAKSMAAQSCEWLKAVVMAIGARLLGILVFALSLALLGLFSGLSTIILLLCVFTLGFIERLILLWYFSVVSVVLSVALCKSGLAMLVMPMASVLGFAEFSFEMFFTNVFAARLVVGLEVVSKKHFNLTEFSGLLVDQCIELLIWLMNNIELDDMIIQSFKEMNDTEEQPMSIADLAKETIRGMSTKELSQLPSPESSVAEGERNVSVMIQSS